MTEVLDVVAHIMLKVTGYVMNFAPLAVFGALAGTVAKEGLGIIQVYGIFVGEFYLGLALLWVAADGGRWRRDRSASAGFDTTDA